MLLEIIVLGIWSKVVTGLEVREVALDVTGGATTAWRGEADVGRHIAIQSLTIFTDCISVANFFFLPLGMTDILGCFQHIGYRSGTLSVLA